MSFVGDVWRGLRSNGEQRALSTTDPKVWRELGWMPRTAAGVQVTTEGALRYSTVLACARVLAGTVAQLPLNVYRRRPNGQGRDRADDFYLYDILHTRPNPLMTSFDYRMAMQGHLALWGNAYSEIERSTRGQVMNLWPLRPDKMEKIEAVETPDGERLLYHYRLPNGKMEYLPQRNVMHLRFMSSDGITGYSPIALHRQGIGLALAAQEFGARFFGNDARPGAILKHPATLSTEAYTHLTESWEARHQGLSRSHRIGILEEGMELQEIGIPPEDAQYIELRKFERGEILGIYGIPPHMISDVERSTSWGTGIEEQSIGFVVYTMGPWFVCWEQGMHMSLMTPAERQQYFTEFVVKGLLRGDSAARSQFYREMFNIGVYSQNDIRRLENENPVEDGDERYVPLNMVPLSVARQGFLPSSNGNGNGDGERGLRVTRARELPEGEPTDATREYRARQAAGIRYRLQQAHMRIYGDVAGRLLRREANDVGNAARRLLSQRNVVEFDGWLREFYEDFQGVVASNMRPVAQAYAELVLAEVLNEVGGDPIAEERIVGFVQEYVQAQGSRHAGRSERAIRDILLEDPENLLEQIEALVDGWREEDRARAIAHEESVRAGNAAAHFGYLALGVSLLRSVSIGDSCPYCRALDGTVISITETFLQAGQSFQPDGAEAPLTVTRSKAHPPYHGGCDCQVVAG